MVTTMLTFTPRRLEMYSQIKFRKSQFIRPPQLGRFRSYSFFNVGGLKSPSRLTKINDLQYIAKAIQWNIKPTFKPPHSKLYLLFTLLPRYIYIPYILKQWIVFFARSDRLLNQWISCTIHWFNSSFSERATQNSCKLQAKCLPGLLP